MPDMLPIEVNPRVSTELSPAEALDLEHQAIAMLRFVRDAGLARPAVLAFLQQLSDEVTAC